MESIFLITRFAYDTIWKTRLERLGPVVMGAEGAFIVSAGASRAYLQRNDAVRDELEPADLARVTSTLPAPIFYSLDFTDIALCRKVLEAIADDPAILVDNDHGVLLPGSDFVHAMRSRPHWDWRMDVP